MTGYSPRAALEADCTMTIDGAPSELLVTELRGDEALSGLFRFSVRLTSANMELDVASMPGRSALLALEGESGTRHVSGIVRAFQRRGQSGSRAHYAAEIVPLHWLLSKRGASRLFQVSNCSDMSVPGVIRKVLEDAGIPKAATRFALQGEYAAREVVVQYRESDMDFISRLMEHEGIFYYFEHSADGHVMVIADGQAAYGAADPTEIPYRDLNGLIPEHEHVFRLLDRERIERGRVTLDDFDFRQPAAQLRVTRSAERQTALELCDHPGEFAERGQGERYAQIQLEEQQARRRVVRMESTVRGLSPGRRFALGDHPSDECNRKYVATAVRHRLTQPQSAAEQADGRATPLYVTRISAIPVETPFRPARVTARPIIHGSQTALVVGPAGEEIWTDEYGRVKVQFHWDQQGQYDEYSSCWIRVAHGWAGGTYGMFFLPRVGQEVVVSFLEGNPDRPVITGSVYNNDNMPPFKLPDEKTRSTIKSRSTMGGGGCNEIRFDDAKDAEQLFLHAQKDLHVRTGSDRVESVAQDRHLTVERHKFELVKRNKHAEVRLDLCEEVGGSKFLGVSGDVGEDIGGNHHEHAAGHYYLDVDGKLVLESATGICLKVGGNFITIDSTGVYVMGTVVHLNGEGAALSATSVEVKTPETPVEADTTQPGSDVTYAPDPYAVEPLTPENGDAANEESDDESLISWIEVELVDEAGRAWPNEPYEVTESDETVHRGSLDANGQAHVAVKSPGDCQISFPNLDRRAWDRT